MQLHKELLCTTQLGLQKYVLKGVPCQWPCCCLPLASTASAMKGLSAQTCSVHPAAAVSETCWSLFLLQVLPGACMATYSQHGMPCMTSGVGTTGLSVD